MRAGSDLEAPELDQPVLELQAGQAAATQGQQAFGGVGAVTPISSGGTGSSTAAGALSNLGAAPSNATYITQTASAGLSAEQNLAALATGYMKSTTATGVVSTQAIPIPVADGGTGCTKVYVALLTQTGTNAPVATVLQNSTGLTITWARTLGGVYTATAGSAGFTANKTVVFMSPITNTAGVANIITYVKTSTSVLTFTTSDTPTGTTADGLLNETAIEICVFP